jgi:glyoxylase-like metal-dependent hydrolase (beta-lactamase superfamily II)
MARTRLAISVVVAALTAGTAAHADQALTVDTHVAGADGFFVTSTLILGQKDAILIDAQLTRSEAHRLVAKILESRRTLRTIYVTHAHPDHVLGLEVVSQAFPRAVILASPKVIVELRKLAKPKIKQWKPVYGANLADRAVFPSPYTRDSLELEGQRIELVPLLPAESDAATAVHIPSLKTVIAGDAVYSGVHPWLSDVDATRRQNWLKNLETLKALAPATVIAGHRPPDRKDLPTAIDFTAAYVRDFDVAAAGAASADDLQTKMLATYQDLQLPIILTLAAQSAFASPGPAK